MQKKAIHRFLSHGRGFVSFPSQPVVGRMAEAGAQEEAGRSSRRLWLVVQLRDEEGSDVTAGTLGFLSQGIDSLKRIFAGDSCDEIWGLHVWLY